MKLLFVFLVVSFLTNLFQSCSAQPVFKPSEEVREEVDANLEEGSSKHNAQEPSEELNYDFPDPRDYFVMPPLPFEYYGQFFDPDSLDFESENTSYYTGDTVTGGAVKGIYLSANIAGIESALEPLITLCTTSAANAMVIDLKTDEGYITFKGIPLADEMGISKNTIPDIHKLLARLKENGIYTIARIVTFKDNMALNYFPEYYIKNSDGIWQDPKKVAWMNPYHRGSWDYVLTYAVAAAELGFDEIQFDYIRFDTAGSLQSADFGDTGSLSRTEIINEFAAYAMKTLKPLGVNVSADVYGTIIGSEVDASIVGQDYVALSKILDIICPMIYPSHYAKNTFGIPEPDLKPYEIISKALLLSNEKLSNIEGHVAVVRPWLQDFSATWVKPHLKYGPGERELQIKACYDAGIQEWLLWDAAVQYDAGGIY